MKKNIIIDSLIPEKMIVDSKVDKVLTNEFSVSEISARIRKDLEQNFSYVKVRGEISGLKIAPSGHVYLSLKDDNAVLAVVCWKNVFQKMRFKPEDGMEVVCAGNITSYPGSSRYQLNAEFFEHTGTGTLMAMLEKRKKQLISEGLFDQAHKKNLPLIPNFIGIVTSPTGAVIRDIIHRTAERFPTRLVVWPVLVQGLDAEKQIAAAITGFNNLHQKPDIIIVARGGGSIEDLWCFNSEEVVRAVFASNIPIISAVGHETDFTLIDFVADIRAPTPTAAAEIALPVLADLRSNIKILIQKLSREVDFICDSKASSLEIMARSLPKPEHLYEAAGHKLKDLFARLQRALQHILTKKSQAYYQLPPLHTPKLLIDRVQVKLETEGEKLPKYVAASIQKLEFKLQNYSSMLEALSHIGTLKRGYSLIKSAENGEIITTTTGLKPGQQVEILMHDGGKQATIN